MVVAVGSNVEPLTENHASSVAGAESLQQAAARVVGGAIGPEGREPEDRVASLAANPEMGSQYANMPEQSRAHGV